VNEKRLFQQTLYKLNAIGSLYLHAFVDSYSGVNRIAFIDFNKDGSKDVFIGNNNSIFIQTDDIFKKTIDLPNTTYTNFEFVDSDNDSDIDLILTSDGKSIIYENENNLTLHNIFAEIRGAEGKGAIGWFDYNNDQFQDVFFTGAQTNAFFYFKVFENIGENSILEKININGLFNPSVKKGDLDNDGDIDLIYFGEKISEVDTLVYILVNNENWPNHIPSEPKNLKLKYQGRKIELSWDKSNDNECSQYNLTYNIRIGSGNEKINIVSPNSDIETGYRKIVKEGNCSYVNYFLIDSLPIGNYNWSVQAIDQLFQGGTWAPEQTFTISVVRADFEADTVCMDQPTIFTDQTLTSGDPITAWEWNFGDGNTSALQHPTHTYAMADTFDVQLIAISSEYSDTITKQVIVKPKPITNFTADLVCQGTATSFINSTEHNTLTIESWQWNFGDGSTSNAEHPGSHGYLNTGDYNATLIAMADNGCSDTATHLVTVAGYPASSISVDGPLSFCSGDSVSLSVESDPQYNYQWLLNGANITGADSSIFKALGTGQYSARITNTIGNCITVSDEATVNVAGSPASPSISTSGPTTFCSSDSVILSVTDNPDYSYNWKLNGGSVGTDSNVLTVKTGGTYSLEVSNATGCTANSVNEVAVTVNPLPVLPTVSTNGVTTFCDGGSVVLSVDKNSDYSYQWKDDDSNISGETSASYTAITSGTFSLRVSTAAGCAVETTPRQVTVNPAPASPSISASGPTTFCSSDSVILSVTDNPDYSYNWKLNGGSVGADSNVLTVKTGGTYSLEVSNATGCAVNSTNTVTIEVKSAPVITNFSVSGSTSFCEGDSLVMGVPFNQLYNYQWLKDGTNLINATYNQLSAKQEGAYQLAVSNEAGCIGYSSEINVSVLPVPPSLPILADNQGAKKGLTDFDNLCVGDSVLLNLGDNPDLTYKWQLNGNPLGSEGTYLVAKTAGVYTAEIINEHGCSCETSNSISISFSPAPQRPNLSFTGNMTVCAGNDQYLTITNYNSNFQYSWLVNGSGTGNQTDRLLLSDQGTYQVRASNDAGCTSLSEITNVSILGDEFKPELAFLSGASIVCPHDEVILNITNPESNLNYQWQRSGTNITGETTSQYQVTAEGFYSVSVKAQGCEIQSDPVEIAYKPALPKPELFAEGPNVWYLACSNDSAASYRWYHEGVLRKESAQHVYIANQELGSIRPTKYTLKLISEFHERFRFCGKRSESLLAG
jgi:PKD repeat protein